MKYDPRLILVSQSKVRAELLVEAGYRFIQARPPFDDASDPVPDGPVTYADMPMRGLPCENQIAERCRKLAQLKAKSLALAGHPRIQQGPHTILLGVHTIITVNGDRIPERLFDHDECRRYLLTLINGCTIRGTTSICFLQPDSGSNDCFDDKTTGVFEGVDAGVIDAYLAHHATTPEWRGLPGGLALHSLVKFWPATFSDDPTAAYGLPMQKIAHALKRWSI